MKFAFALAAALMFSGSAYAGCYGGSTFQTCSDDSGNSYTVNRFGNTTIMDGYNSQTGSSWSQTSQTFGNTTYHNGETNGRSWDMQQNNFGNTQMYSGTDADGNSFNYTCSYGSCY